MEKANAVVLFVLQASLFHKSVEISAFWQRYRSIRIGHIFYGAFRWFFSIKNHLCAGDYAATVCAIKSTQLKQGRTTRCVLFNTRTYPSLFRKRFNFFVIRKAKFRTQKRFHNKQYTPKSKDQPFESERTHFDIGFNNGNLQCTVKPLFFFFHTKSQPFNKKQPIGTINQIKQSERTIQKTNLQNKHDKPSHQSNVKSITKKPQQTTHTISQSKTRPK